MDIKEKSMSSTRQTGNQGRLGFFETNDEIAMMEYNLIDFSAAREKSINIGDFTGGTGRPLKLLHDHLLSLGAMPKTYYNELDKGRYNEAMEKYEKEFSMLRNLDVTKMRIGTHNGKVTLNTKNFSVIRDNPPYYGTDDSDGIHTRLEREIIFRNSDCLVTGGIHLIELPIHIALDNLKMLCNRYQVTCIAKFPEEVYKKFKQVVLFCKLKKSKGSNLKLEKIYKEMIEEDELPYLDELEEPVIKITGGAIGKGGTINYFRDPQTNITTLQNGFNQVSGLLANEFRSKHKVVSFVEGKTPPMSLSSGHISTLLMAGYYDGILGDLLVRGGTNKIIKEIKSTDDKTGVVTVEHLEVFRPFIDITNKNGDAYYKEFIGE